MEVENKFKYNKDDFIKCETNINKIIIIIVYLYHFVIY